MARATDNIQGWSKLLEALNNDDIDLAREITISYKFDLDEINLSKCEEVYVAVRPDGKKFKAHTSYFLSKEIGVNKTTLATAFNEEVLPYEFKKGKLKGWKVYIKLQLENRRKTNGFRA